jgi:HK97 family phage major capsid protein
MTDMTIPPAVVAAVREKRVQVPAQVRAAGLQTINEAKRTVTVMWSAGARVLRYDWWEGEYFIEELSMDPAHVDLGRLQSGAPVLDTHQRHGVSNIVGVVDRVWIQGGRGYADIRFSARDDVAPIWQDVRDGIIRNVSVGYDIGHMSEAGFDPDTGHPILLVDRWAPFEISLVPVGADPEAGTRDAPSLPHAECVIALRAAAAPVSQTPAQPATTKEAIIMAEVQAPAAPTAGNEGAMSERLRIQTITNLARTHKIDDKTRDEWIGSGLSSDAVAERVLDVLAERGKTNPQSASQLGLSEKETQQFSILRAVVAARDKDWSRAGYEAECSRAIAQKLGKTPDATRFFVPLEVQQRQINDPRMQGRRDLTAGTGSAGGFLVATENQGFIELLRNRSVVMNAGARRLTGLQGNLTIPRQSGAATAYWLSTEATAITESQQTLGQLAFTPKTAGAYTEISRLLALQASPDAESMVMADLAAVVGLAVDAAAISGSGSSGQPTGIVNTAGIGSVTGTSIAYAGVLEFQTDVAGANALSGSCAYVTTPAVAALLMQRVKFSSTASPIWEGNVLDGVCAGFRGMSSNQMPSANLLFGDFNQLVIGEWGTLEIEVNPYANFAAGIMGVRAMYSIDVGVRYAGAFSLATSVT